MGLIRVFLANSVVIWHFGGPDIFLVNGYLAVICFFIISGFYISMIITDRYYCLPHFKTRFYASRALRLYPIYLIITVSFGVYWLVIGTPVTKLLNLDYHTPWIALVLLSNVVIFGLDVLSFINHTFVPAGLMRMIGPAWSLGVELQFYLAAPFIVMRSLRSILVVLVLTLAIRFAFLSHAYDPWRYCLAPSDWCFFMLGVVGHKLTARWPTQLDAKRYIGVGCCVTLCAMTGPVGLFRDGDLDTMSLWFFYLLLAASLPYIFELTKNSAWDASLGDLSYPTYVVHPLVLTVTLACLGEPPTLYNGFGGLYAYGFVWCGVALAAVFLAAAGLHYMIELPVDRLRNRVKRAVLKGRPEQSSHNLRPRSTGQHP